MRLIRKCTNKKTNTISEIKSKVSVYPENVCVNNTYGKPIIILKISLFLVTGDNIQSTSDLLGSLRLNMILLLAGKRLRVTQREMTLKNRKKISDYWTVRLHLKSYILLYPIKSFFERRKKKKTKNVTNNLIIKI